MYNQFMQNAAVRICISFILIWIWGGSTLTAQAQQSKGTVEEPSLYAERNSDTSKRLTEWQEQFHLPSISLAIRIKDKIVYAEAKGLASIADGRKATIETPYAVGSIAKPMTTAALMKLVQDGKLNLDDSIHDRIVDYPVENGGFNIRQLASHTAGVPHRTNGRLQKEYGDPKTHLHPHESLDFFKDNELLFKPGSGFAYSSSGYVLLSDVIAKASGMPYTTAMQKLVFDPLNMPHTEHDIQGAAVGTEAVYYSRFDNGEFVPARTKRDRSFLFGGGGYLSTPVDLVNMAQSMRNTDYLTQKLQDELFTPVLLDSGKENPQNYALGWRIDSSQNLEALGKPVLGIHHGGTVSGAASAFLLTYPEYEASIAFATNTIPKSDDRDANLRNEIWNLLGRYVASDTLSSSEDK